MFKLLKHSLINLSWVEFLYSHLLWVCGWGRGGVLGCKFSLYFALFIYMHYRYKYSISFHHRIYSNLQILKLKHHTINLNNTLLNWQILDFFSHLDNELYKHVHVLILRWPLVPVKYGFWVYKCNKLSIELNLKKTF